jgi:hypothetical protein
MCCDGSFACAAFLLRDGDNIDHDYSPYFMMGYFSPSPSLRASPCSVNKPNYLRCKFYYLFV